MTSDPAHFRVFTEIGIINQLAQTMFERVMPAGMTLAQFLVLNHFVLRGGAQSPAELANAFQITRATMTSTLKKLGAKSFIAVAPDPDDGRGKKVSLTPEGRAMRERCLAALAPELTKIAAMWPAEEAAKLLPSLSSLRALLDRARD